MLSITRRLNTVLRTVLTLALVLVLNAPVAAAAERSETGLGFGFWNQAVAAWKSALDFVFAPEAGHLDPNGDIATESELASPAVPRDAATLAGPQS